MTTQEIIQHLAERRQRVLDGKVNCIPSPFPRFSRDFVGIEKKKYYCITANTKIGKTQIANYIFVYHAIMYAYEHPEQVRVKIYYYNLEEDEENIKLRFMSYLLYKFSKGQTRLSLMDLTSTRQDKPLDITILNTLSEQEPYKSILAFYDQCIEFRTERHPTGIHKSIESYLAEHGTVYYKDQVVTDFDTKEKRTIKTFDRYEPDDPDEYFIPIIDHAGLLSTEAGAETTKKAMDLLSTYLVKDRNRYKISPVLVVQQAADVESTENFKLKKLRPTANGLGDSKTIGRDFDIMLGLFSPFRHEIKEYMQYDITRFRNNIRFMEVIINRGGEQNGLCPLYFDGCTNFFAELPLPDNPAINNYYQLLQSYKKVNLLIKKPKSVWQKLLQSWVTRAMAKRLQPSLTPMEQ